MNGLVVEGLDGELARTGAAGATVEEPTRDMPYDKIAMSGYPSGHRFCLIGLNGAAYAAVP